MLLCAVCPNNIVKDNDLCCGPVRSARVELQGTYLGSCIRLGTRILHTCRPFHLGPWKTSLSTEVIAAHSW